MLLNCHSYYSLNYGCLSVEEVLQTVKDLGYSEFTVTDINNTSETFRFLMRAEEYNLKVNIGIDFRNGIQQQYIGIAKNKRGFFELNEHLSHHQEKKESIPPIAPQFNHAYIIYPSELAPHPIFLKPNEFIGISPADLKNTTKQKEWKHYQDKLVILSTSTFRHKRDYNTHRLLRAIGENTLLSKLPKIRQANSENTYRSRAEIEELYSQYPKILHNTKELQKSCKVNYNFKRPKNKLCFTSNQEEDIKLLTKLSHDGLKYRYKQVNETILARLDNELKLIEQCGFCAYFLINWDLVQYAQSKGYCHVGRGSGANSLVAYLLRITNVDPIDLDLYFERFINPYRNSPPDFDVDFSWTDRDDITHYLFDKYGWDKVVLLGSYVTFQRKAVVRELGKVFGLPAEEIKSLQRSGIPKDEYSALIIRYSEYIAGFPSHLSIHASGILISEEPIHYYSSTFLPPKNFPTTHFDMQIAEDIGLHKYDILSQRGLGKISDAVALVKENRSVSIDINAIEKIKQDQRVKRLLREGDLTGCFYVESPAMRMLMTKLKAEDYTRLVAASSIIRPGVSKSGMMREYILRFQSVERRKQAQKALPELYKILEETYGVMVYQEDVIKVAHLFAELTLAEADILRRGMSWKFRERTEFSQVEQRFFDNCYQKGYAEKTVKEIWYQIESFANYAFSKGHSASYAVESFQALYIHAYYPIEYLTATLNNGGGFYSREVYVHTAKMKGATIALPCVNTSKSLAKIIGDTIHLGLSFIRGGFERENVFAILKERQQNGPYLSFRNFVERLPRISLEQTIILIRTGCFRHFEKNKKKLMWDAHFLLSEEPSTTLEKINLFQIEPKTWKLPELVHTQLEDAYDEIEYLGFPVSISPFEMLEKPKKLTPFYASDLRKNVGKVVSIAGYKVNSRSVRASNKQAMQFGTFVDQKGHWIDTVIFPNVYKRHNYIAPGCHIITGKVGEEFGHLSLEVHQLERLENMNLREG